MTTSSNERYEFQPPTNIVAIRSSIMQRIKQQRQVRKSSAASSVTSSPSPLTPPSNVDEYEKLSFLAHLDNGLPSPPIEACLYEQVDKLPSEMVVSALLDLSQDQQLDESPPSPVMSTTTTVTAKELESSTVIREKIRALKEEKHKLFQVMKDLLSKPAATVVTVVEKQSPVTIATKPLATATTTERPRSQSRDSTSLKSRPIIRSRSISHTEFGGNGRPISRYYDRNSSSSSRFYNNGYYPYNRTSYPTVQQQQQQVSLSSSSNSNSNMSRRVINNNNNNSSYVSSRPQLAVRSSSSSSFRLPSRPDRY